MAKNVITYAVQDLFFGLPNKPRNQQMHPKGGTFPTSWNPMTGFTGQLSNGSPQPKTFEVLQRINFVQNFNYSIDFPREKIATLGRNTYSEKGCYNSGPPSVNLDFSYYVGGINNEERMGFAVRNQINQWEQVFVSGLYDLADDRKNIYLAIDDTTTDVDMRSQIKTPYPDKVSGYVPVTGIEDANSKRYRFLVFMNSYINRYSINMNVGQLATVNVGAVADNLFFTTGIDTGFGVPYINTENASTGFGNTGIIVPNNFANNSETFNYPDSPFKTSDIKMKLSKRSAFDTTYESDFSTSVDSWVATKGAASLVNFPKVNTAQYTSNFGDKSESVYASSFSSLPAISAQGWVVSSNNELKWIANYGGKTNNAVLDPSNRDVSIHALYRNSVFTIGKTYRVRGEVYVNNEGPAGNGTFDSVGIWNNTSAARETTISTKNSWASFDITFTADHAGLYFYAMNSAGSTSFSASETDDSFGIREIVVTEEIAASSDGWTDSNVTTTPKSTDYGATAALKVNATTANGYHRIIYSSVPGVTAGKRYKITAKIYIPDDCSTLRGIQFRHGNGISNAGPIIHPTLGEWTDIEYEWTADPRNGADYADMITFWMANSSTVDTTATFQWAGDAGSSDRYYIEDIVITEMATSMKSDTLKSSHAIKYTANTTNGTHQIRRTFLNNSYKYVLRGKAYLPSTNGVIGSTADYNSNKYNIQVLSSNSNDDMGLYENVDGDFSFYISDFSSDADGWLVSQLTSTAGSTYAGESNVLKVQGNGNNTQHYLYLSTPTLVSRKKYKIKGRAYIKNLTSILELRIHDWVGYSQAKGDSPYTSLPPGLDVRISTRGEWVYFESEPFTANPVSSDLSIYIFANNDISDSWPQAYAGSTDDDFGLKDIVIEEVGEDGRDYGARLTDQWVDFSTKPFRDDQDGNLFFYLRNGKSWTYAAKATDHFYLADLEVDRLGGEIEFAQETVQSCNIDLDLSRDTIQYLGHKLPYNRPLRTPVKIKADFEMLVSGHLTGNLFDDFILNEEYDLNIDFVTGDNVIGLNYQLSGMRLDSANYDSSIGSNKTASLSFSSDFDFDGNFNEYLPTKGFFASGRVMTVEPSLLISGVTADGTVVYLTSGGVSRIQEDMIDVFRPRF